ncbi:fumarylacetoacetate hydrolase family protein [Vitreoscilla filiformis]|uniref:fumarylacetoacetate hydrolase family protein n=1 Tax=Vitreoscilla filiformis TaxID=63 RepID=UPI000B79C8D4|nr:fumarylacetoacetate hydrolase family protein [Vitreoscilla filiformis]
MTLFSPPGPPPSWRPRSVYTALLNDPAQLAELGDAVHQPPYKAAPRAPVLALQPRNTWSRDGAAVAVPPAHPWVQSGATLGLVMGRVACRVTVAEALAHVAGYILVNDLELPDDGPQRHYRPGVRRKARDGFCPLGERIVPAHQIADPDALTVRVFIDGALAQESTTAGRVRHAAQWLADVSEFMTLYPGDVLTLGVAANAPRARAGQTLSVSIEGLGTLSNPVVLEGGAA